MSFKKISQQKELEQLFKDNERFFLLKNSTTCPISHEAYKETENFAEENTDVPVYYLNVQEARPLSNYIAEKFQIKHESPQAILFENEKVTWHDSHWRVTKDSLKSSYKK
ncbi:bacillithiol system redox-active protein YtxJ [Evansella tamaricis]|uniref:Bacillithiol system redox-active protein YtxJ n=1 Tax=Evansella tamaricis TaxID=2069301 RepID=A0ABS6JQU5_9BACI|nr:bacillithiol system redox-active protein YtxJ [Evansella tamaricis]MBU9714683.1 bacillithiol system redox-active protein YtxJ [Evansella tamaricis]